MPPESDPEMLKPHEGVASCGGSVDPKTLGEIEPHHSADRCEAAPAPGMPVSLEVYERLKAAAELESTPSSTHAQEDRSRPEGE